MIRRLALVGLGLALQVGCGTVCHGEPVTYDVEPGTYVFEITDTTEAHVRDQFPDAADGPVVLEMGPGVATLTYMTVEDVEVHVVMDLGARQLDYLH